MSSISELFSIPIILQCKNLLCVPGGLLGNFIQPHLVKRSQFFGHFNQITTFVAFSAMGSRCQIRRIGLQNDIFQINLRYEFIDSPVLKGYDSSDPEFHSQCNGMLSLFQITGKAMEDPEQIFPFFFFQYLKNLIKSIAAMNDNGQLVSLGQMDLPAKSIFLLG